MAVSLKKTPAIREYTPVHLMDEEEAVRIFCPRREERTGSKTEKSVKETNKDNPPKVTVNSDSNLDKDLVWARIIGTLIGGILTILLNLWFSDFLTAFNPNV